MRDSLVALEEMRAKVDRLEQGAREPLAVIGMSCRIPSSIDTPEGFWRMLRDGVDAVREVPPGRWDVNAYYDPDPNAPGKSCTRYGTFLDGVDQFDAAFFRIAPREAASMDPQQRLLLETAWEAIESAGQSPERLRGSATGVFLGICTSDYSRLLSQRATDEIDAYLSTGNSHSVASGRLSFFLGLQGPNYAVDTACSSSLLAVHLAAESIRRGECDMALAGGVNAILTPDLSINFSKAHMLAPDGRCKTFDAAADGYVRGEGAGFILLKRLSRALADGDPVLAVLRGSAVNHDGQAGGLTVPNGPAQQSVIRRALENGGVSPAEVSYIEAHGTGTSLGDPIEIGALAAVFGKSHSAAHPLWVGSVKTNIGHLEAAAGIVGVIKLVLALQHGEIPPHLHFRKPSPHIPWDQIPISVPTEPIAWAAPGGRRIGGVSAFGFSGTNVHVVLEEAPPPKPVVGAATRPVHLLTLSAKAPKALESLAGRYAQHLADRPETDLGDLCHTASTGRAHAAHRLALVGHSAADFHSRLEAFSRGQAGPGVVQGQVATADPPRIGLLFTGQGSQYVGMGRQLYQTSRLFREALERCDAALRPLLAQPLLSVLFPQDGAHSPLDDTAYTQPTLFALEYALVQLWRSWGIGGAALLGHSVGEYVAACVADVFSLEDGLQLIAGRARLMQELPRDGQMVALATDEAHVRSVLRPWAGDVSIAAVNGPKQVVISGRCAAVEAVVAELERQSVRHQRLTVSHAFHSPLMEPMLPAFRRLCSAMALRPPQMKLVSNLYGGLVGDEVTSPEYWCRHIRETVQFAAGMQALKDAGCTVFLEIGPKPILSAMGRNCLPDASLVWLPSLREGREDWLQMLESLARLYTGGARVDWAALDADQPRRKLSLPTYPFQRQRYWAEGAVFSPRKPASAEPAGSPLAQLFQDGHAEQFTRQLQADTALTPDEARLLPQLLSRLGAWHRRQEAVAELKDYLYEIAWEKREAAEAPSGGELQAVAPGRWLIFADQGGTGAALAGLLKGYGHECVMAYREGYGPAEQGARHLNPLRPADYQALFRDFFAAGGLPCRGIVHLWSLDADASDRMTLDALDASLTLGCRSVLHLVQEGVKAREHSSARLWLVTRAAVAVDDQSGPLAMSRSALWGMSKGISLEFPDFFGGILDLPADGSPADLAALAGTLRKPTKEDLVALRGGQCYVARLVRSEPRPVGPLPIHAAATYLVTGGLGGLGIKIARWLIDRGARHLVLIGRQGAATSEQQQACESLRQAGAEVRALAADVTRAEDLSRVLGQIDASMPPLRGVVHVAGRSGYQLLRDMKLDAFEDVLRPKVVGGWLLHQATRDRDLDFFVTFGSIASVWGSRGQSHYAAANHFLDALAWHRRALGLPGTTIDWGPWSGIGMAAANATAMEYLARTGIRPLAPERALAALEYCFAAQPVQQTVAEVDWVRFKAVFEARGEHPLLARIERDQKRPARDAQVSQFVQAVLSAPPERRKPIVVAHLQKELGVVLGLGPSDPIDPRKGFFDLGIDSLTAVELKTRLEQALSRELPATLAFDYPTIDALAEHVVTLLPGGVPGAAAAAGPSGAAPAGLAQAAGPEPIAILGMACRFPNGVENAEQFWELLSRGGDAVSEIPPDRWDVNSFYDPDPQTPGKMYTRYGGFLHNVDLFDAQFFGIAPREAASMDPQQRLLLEVSWEALENAGIPVERLAGNPTGVFIGVSANEYSQLLTSASDLAEIDAYLLTGNALNVAAGRISYVFGLDGPSMAIDTACSSSLSALHTACQSLRNRDCDVALAGGANLILTPTAMVATCRARMLAPDGSCKAFDAQADGYVRGEGVGVLVLKRLCDALAAGDPVLAVIRGSAVNQDGRSGGLTVPNGPAQQRVIRRALAAAGVSPADVGYIEAHGTGTSLGDPVEVGALAGVFGPGRTADAPLWFASVKTNIGHLESAAGMPGVIKIVLMLCHRAIPPHLHFHRPNPHIDWKTFALRVPTELMPWPAAGKRRLAGVSGFGFSGTNAHAVIEEAPEPPPPAAAESDRPLHLLTLSAKTPEALRALANRYARYLHDHPQVNLANVCHTAGACRSHFRCRAAMPVASAGEAVRLLEAIAAGQEAPSVLAGNVPAGTDPQVVMLFADEGLQYAGLGEQLYRTQPAFRRTLARCDAILSQWLDQPLLGLLYPRPDAPSLLDQARYAQPAIFAIEYALARLWQSWGVRPAAMLGQGVGEYVAACLAGVFSLEDALKLVAARARLMQSPGGAGKTADAPGAEPSLREAFLAEFAQVCREVGYTPPQAKVISSDTGGVARDEIATADYWCRRTSTPAGFAQAIAALAGQGYEVLLEAGPHSVLASQDLPSGPRQALRWLPSLCRDREDWQQLLETLGMLYARGASIDWRGFDADYPRTRVLLPTYPFQRERFWPKSHVWKSAAAPAPETEEKPPAHPFLGTRASIESSQETTFERQVACASPAYMSHHRLFETVIVPGASHVSMVLSAAKEIFGQSACVVSNLVFPQVLALPEEGERTYRLALKPGRSGVMSWQALSLQEEKAPDDASAWLVHANGELEPLAAAAAIPEATVDLAALQLRLPERFAGSAFYALFRQQGYTLGPAFCWIGQGWRAPGEALCQMVMPEIPDALEDYQLYPGLIDACFQLLATCAPSGEAAAGDEESIFIPFRIGQFRLYRRPEAGPLWCHGRGRGEPSPRDPSRVADIWLYDPSGRLVAEVVGFESRRASRKLLLAGLGQDSQQWLYQIAWQRQDRKPPATPADGQSAGVWLLFAEGQGVAAALAPRFGAAGGRAVIVDRGSAYTASASGDRYTIDPSSPAQFHRLLEDVLREGHDKLNGVLYLWALDAAENEAVCLESLAEAENLTCRGLLHLVQALARREWREPPRLWLLTRAAQPVTPESPVQVAQAPLWGLGRVLAMEHPEFRCVRIDLAPTMAAADWDALFGEIVAPDQEDQLALRGGARFVARLARQDLVAKNRIPLPPAGPYRLKLAQYGTFENLTIAPIERRAPGPGEVEVAVKAAGLNFRDVLRALGMLREYEKGLLDGGPSSAPFGFECSGTISAVGPGVERLAVDDEVIGLIPGSMASHVTIDARYVLRRPKELDPVEAVGCSFVYMTAYYGLCRLAKLQRGERILIHAAAGGVGQAAVRYAQAVGAEIFATASPAKWEFLRSQGIRHVMHSRTLDFADQIRELTGGEGVDVVLNSLNGEFIPKSLSALKPGGRFVEIGVLGAWTAAQMAEARPDVSYYPFDMIQEEFRDRGFLMRLLEELLEELRQGKLQPIPCKVFSIDHAPDAFRFMAQAKHVGKVVIATARADADQRAAVQADAAYLITGGCGALGLRVAQRLAQRGARHLVLVGRGAPSAEAEEAMRQLQAGGVRVDTMRADVSVAEDAQRVVDAIGRCGRPLRGIVHSAGLLNDGMLAQQEWAQFQTALAPKIYGGWNLHRLTRDMPLDFFVCFSSVAAVLGSPGQGNYAAGNAFLDALAHARQAAHLPALSIDWGPWSDVGMASRMSRHSQARWRSAGFGMVSPDRGLDLFDKLLGEPTPQVCVMPIKWDRLLAQSGGLPLFEKFREALGQSTAAESAILGQLKAAPAHERESLLAAFVRGQLARMLGLDSAHPVPLDQGFFEIGMDSLMAVELRNHLQNSLAISIPLTLTIDYPTVNALVAYLLGQLPLGGVKAGGATPEGRALADPVATNPPR
jgi:acyl transferase domain-containing protein/acyl carrier protein